MRRYQIAAFLGSLLLASTGFATDNCLDFETTGAAIHTYGGGDLLEKVFNALALILYGGAESGIGKAFNGIVRLSLAIGGFSCACMAFFREKFDPLIKTFFLPSIGIVCFLLVPRTSVMIIDHIGQKTSSSVVFARKKVNNVPYFLGKLATLVSEVSYYMERLFTDRTHDPKDKMYNWTGNIYASTNIFRAKKCRITNPVIEDDFREFCRECVFRDIGIGLYTKDALIKAPNILAFLQENTSNMRTVFYKDPTQEGAAKSECLTCREAITKMNQLFNGKEGNAKEIIFGELGNQVHFLLDQKELGGQDLKNLIKQQIAIDILKEELPGTLDSFASKRAEILQKENQKILGALGASSLVAMRNFFEATIYMVFPIIVIVALLSFGIQAIIQWVQFLLWVNTWPLFYIIVNFMLNSIWDARKKTILGGSTDLTIFSSEGLSDLYSSMESIAAIALAFIPYLSWILLKGGVHQMVQLASSIMSPAQSAASTAASESISGNYSFGNISLESTNGYNAQMFRQTYSGVLSQGSVGIDSGSETLTYAPLQDDLYLKQSDSYLREGISKTDAFSSSLQSSLSSSQTALSESSNAVSASLTNTVNKGVGFVDAISRHLQQGENFNTQESSTVQDSFQYIKNVTDEYAESKGIGKDAALREMISAGFGGKVFGVKGDIQGSWQDGLSTHSSATENERANESSGFQQHLQTIRNLSSGEVASVLGSEDAKLHQDFVQSLSETESSMDQWRTAYSKQEAFSNLQSYAENDNLSIHQNLNQRFVEFLREKFDGDSGLLVDATELSNMAPQKRALIDEFVSDYLPSTMPSDNVSPPHHLQLDPIEAPSESRFESQKAVFLDTMKPQIGHDFGELGEEISHTASRTNLEKENVRQDIQQDVDQSVLDRYESDQTDVKSRIDEGISPSSIFKLSSGQAIGSGLSSAASLWHSLFSEKNLNEGKPHD